MAAKKSPRYRLEWVRRIAAVPKEAWNALAVPLATPVLEWEWLHRLEISGSVSPETGWLPLHLAAWQGAELAGAAPLYVKSHSEGEFVWDYMWADAAGQLGVPYYPKMIGMSPATPVSGYRFLIAPGQDERTLTAVMVEAIERLCRRNNLAALSFNYVDPSWRPLLEELGFTAWKHQSFLWENPGFSDFEQYLWSFDKNQRRNIRRERRKLPDQGLLIRPLTGEQISLAHLEWMYRFYERTNARFGPWAAKYLTRTFFTGLHEDYRHRLLLMAAFHRGEGGEAGSAEASGEEPVGMSFLLRKNDSLFGRYWGSSGDYDSLHFNACYYSPIEWAIANRVRRFDPGIGSSHKLRRGFRAVANWSLHRFFDQRLAAVMRRHIEQINRMTDEQIQALNRALPFAERKAKRPPK